MSEIDRAMLQSMAASFRGALEFSFNRHDMAKLMDRCATRTDLSQAAVAAALEAAAQTVDTLGDSAVTEALGARLCCDGHMCGCQGADVGEYILHHIRALITPAQHDALAAHVAAEVAKARAEDAATVLRYRPTGENSKHFVDVLVCDIANEILTGKKAK